MKDGATVILFRHGIAEPKGRIPDEERRLTEEGVREMEEVARAMARLLPHADAIWTSPLVRAVQTAEILARAYARPMHIRRTDALRPESDSEKFRDLLASLNTRCTYFVGHEPNLSTCMRVLTGLEGEIELAKAGCYGLRWRNGGVADLEWMLAPAVVKGPA